MPKVIWTGIALADIEGYKNDLEEVSPDAAERAAQAIRKAGDSLENNPRRGASVQDAPGVRKLKAPFGKYGFVIHYAILDDEVVILKVYHGRQNRPT